MMGYDSTVEPPTLSNALMMSGTEAPLTQGTASRAAQQPGGAGAAGGHTHC